MMRLALALLVALFPQMLPAQTALWIDLTGEWRTMEGDDQRYASAGTESFVSDAVYEPPQEVGGDFYWTRVEPGGALLVVVGDVSGKGLKAAMLVSVVVGMLRTVKESSPSAILEALNDGLAGHTGGGFVTSCCARFDATGSVTLANAGHPAPYCDGHEVAVEAGLPLGVMAGVAYEESVVQGEHSRSCPTAWSRPKTRGANSSASTARARSRRGPRNRSPTRPRPGARTTTSPY